MRWVMLCMNDTSTGIEMYTLRCLPEAMNDSSDETLGTYGPELFGSW